MLTARKTKNRDNMNASGVVENVTEETQLLDDFLLEIEEAKLERRRENEQFNENEKKHIAAGEEIQRMALARVSKTAKPFAACEKTKKRRRHRLE
eukprot:IDg4819t1